MSPLLVSRISPSESLSTTDREDPLLVADEIPDDVALHVGFGGE